MPQVWLLGSSGFSAQLAGMLGLPFSFAHHFSSANTVPALALYRQHFRPSSWLDQPYAMVAVNVVCADTDERAEWLAGPSSLSFLRLRAGRPQPLSTPEEAAAYPYTEPERDFILQPEQDPFAPIFADGDLVHIVSAIDLNYRLARHPMALEIGQGNFGEALRLRAGR